MSESAFKLEGMTLANLAEGKLEEQFQERLAQLIEIFADSSRYESSDKITKAEISLSVVFARPQESPALSITVRAELKGPKPLRAGGTAYLRGDAICIEPYKQEPLPLELPRRIRPVEGDRS